MRCGETEKSKDVPQVRRSGGGRNCEVRATCSLVTSTAEGQHFILIATLTAQDTNSQPWLVSNS